MCTKPVFKSAQGQQLILDFYDGLLADCGFIPEQHWIETGAGKTFVLAAGKLSSPPLVLLHGTANNSAMWLSDMVTLRHSFRVHAVDMIGEPGKTQGGRPALKSGVYREWLSDVFRGLDIESAVIVGVSLGGWLALDFACADSRAVTKLMLLCPAGIAPVRSSFLFKAAFLFMLGDWGRDRLNRIVYHHAQIPAQADRFGKLILKHCNPRMEPVPILENTALQRLTMPVRLIAGKHDVLLPSQKTAKRLKRLVPHAKVDLTDEGHALWDKTKEIASFSSMQ